MCGRYALFQSENFLANLFGFHTEIGLSPNYNASPGQSLPVIIDHGERCLRRMTWGFIPRWSKDGRAGFSNNNARAETIEEKAAYRDSFRSRRCLIPADAFYEWRRNQKPIQPYCLGMADSSLFAMAGIWDRWEPAPGQTGTAIDSFSVIVTKANRLVSTIHDRMPVIVHPSRWDLWLSERTPSDMLRPLLAPCPSSVMRAYPISTRVNAVRNNDTDLLNEVQLDEPPIAEKKISQLSFL